MPSPLIPVGQLFSETWQQYRRDWKLTFQIAVWLALPVVFSQLVALFSPQLVGPVVWLLLLGTLVIQLIIYVLVPARLLRFILGSDPHRSQAQETTLLSWPWSLFWPYVWVAILQTLILVLPLLLAIIPVIFSLPAVLSPLFSGGQPDVHSIMAVAGGSVLLLLAAIVVMTWLSVKFNFSTYSLIEDDKHGVSALKASSALVKGHWWAVFGRFFLAGLILGGVLLALQLVVTLITIPLVDRMPVVTIFALLLSLLIELAIVPWYLTWHVKIFHSLKKA